MTMSREAKSEKLGMLQKIRGGHQEQAHSPKLRAAMVADHGAPTYTAEAWKQHRMHRSGGRIPAEMIRSDKTTKHIQANRKSTRKG